MPFDGNGLFTRLFNWVNEQASPPILVSKLDTQEEDVATALSNCVLRDGTGMPATSVGTSGTFTGTLDNMSGSVTGTFHYSLINGQVMVWTDASITGTSTGTAMGMTGMPAAIKPTTQRYATCNGIIDNSLAVFSAAVVATSGSVQFRGLVLSGSAYTVATAFMTASGTKGVQTGFTMTYPL